MGSCSRDLCSREWEVAVDLFSRVGSCERRRRFVGWFSRVGCCGEDHPSSTDSFLRRRDADTTRHEFFPPSEGRRHDTSSLLHPSSTGSFLRRRDADTTRHHEDTRTFAFVLFPTSHPPVVVDPRLPRQRGQSVLVLPPTRCRGSNNQWRGSCAPPLPEEHERSCVGCTTTDARQSNTPGSSITFLHRSHTTRRGHDTHAFPLFPLLQLIPGSPGNGVSRFIWGLLGELLSPFLAMWIYKAVHGPGTAHCSSTDIAVPAGAGSIWAAEFFGTMYLVLSYLASKGNLVGMILTGEEGMVCERKGIIVRVRRYAGGGRQGFPWE